MRSVSRLPAFWRINIHAVHDTSYKGHLKKHTKAVHDKIRNHVCRECGNCGYAASYQGYLKRHISCRGNFWPWKLIQLIGFARAMAHHQTSKFKYNEDANSESESDEEPEENEGAEEDEGDNAPAMYQDESDKEIQLQPQIRNNSCLITILSLII